MAKAAKSAAPKKEVAAPAASSPKTASLHHNSIDPAREKVFIAGFSQVKAAETSMAGTRGELAAIYKRLETAGFSKDHIAFAKSLEKKNVAEVIADFKAKIEICMMMGHQAGRQLDMLDKDRTPIEDQAYIDGLAAGKMGRAAANPYGMETIAGQRWQEGMNEGIAFRNAAINEAVNGGNLIKGADDEDGSEGGAEEIDSAGEGEEGGEAEADFVGSGEAGFGSVDGEGKAVLPSGSDDDAGVSDNSGDSDGDVDQAVVGAAIPTTDDDDDWNDADPNK